MVVDLTIVGKKGHADLYKPIKDALAIHANICEKARGEWQVVLVSPKNRNLTEGLDLTLRALLADVLEEHILTELKQPLLQDMIRKHYYYLTRPEREKVFYYSSLRDSTVSRQAQQQVRENLRNYLANCRHLNLWGLIRFRLPCYLEGLKNVVEGAVDDYLIEKEYQEFIKLLKYFVEIQEPKVLEAHVLLDPGGRFQIRDGQKRLVDQDSEEMKAAYLKDRVDSEDMLVSALVTAAPGRVILHRQVDARYPKLSGTLKKIFEGKMTLCGNCPECASQAKVKYPLATD